MKQNSYPTIPAQKILITGGTGFIGRPLCNTLLAQGHTLTLLVRNQVRAAILLGNDSRLKFINSVEQLQTSNSFDTVINLAGESLASGRWNPHKKHLIRASRLDTTRQLIVYIKNAQIKPKQFISGSAIGYYGPHKDDSLTESSSSTPCFSSDLCVQWEAIAQQAQDDGVRVCLLRTGIVLGKTGGALKSMLLPFSLGLGGNLGHGKQWMSWIHIADLIGIILELMRNESISGPVNATAPNPVTNAEFTKTLGSSLHRPTMMAMPAFMLRLLMGEVADELLLTGQKVIPHKLLEQGFKFQYPLLPSALANIIYS